MKITKRNCEEVSENCVGFISENWGVFYDPGFSMVGEIVNN